MMDEWDEVFVKISSTDKDLDDLLKVLKEARV